MATIITMADVLSDKALRPAVIDDGARLVDDEVKRKSGFSGTLIKSGYAVVSRLHKGRMIHDVLEVLLDEFCESIEPIHAEFRGNPVGSFAAHLEKEQDRATQALLTVTDKRAEKSDHKILKKTYTKLRPRAEEHVKQALPALGQLVDKHTRRA